MSLSKKARRRQTRIRRDAEVQGTLEIAGAPTPDSLVAIDHRRGVQACVTHWRNVERVQRRYITDTAAALALGLDEEVQS